jgi:hypothetical protein
MSHTQRTTRECSFADLRPELAEAVRAHAQRQHWQAWEAAIAACCETTTERTQTNRLEAWLNSSTPALSYVALIATPDRLIWAFSSKAAPAGAASALFKEMRLKIFTPKNKAGIAIDIYARMDGSRDKAGGRFMLDDGPAARHFSEEVKRLTDPLVEPEKPRRKLFGK